jgi:hypothetical protein
MKNLERIKLLENLLKETFEIYQRQKRGMFKRKLQEQILEIENELLIEINKK